MFEIVSIGPWTNLLPRTKILYQVLAVDFAHKVILLQLPVLHALYLLKKLCQ